MKKSILYVLFCLLSLNVFSSDDVLLVYLHDGSFHGFYEAEIDSITYSAIDIDSIVYDKVVTQEIWAHDTVYRIPIAEVDSISYVMPENKFQENTQQIDEDSRHYIIGHDDYTIYYDNQTPMAILPKEGDVLYYEQNDDLFPQGFAGKVSSVSFDGSSIVVSCDSATITDIYEKFTFFGYYAITQSDEPDKPLRAIKARPYRVTSEDDESDDGGLSWELADYSGKPESLDPIIISHKIKFGENFSASIKGKIIHIIKAEWHVEAIKNSVPYVYCCFDHTTTKDYSINLEFGKKIDTSGEEYEKLIDMSSGFSKTNVGHTPLRAKIIPEFEMPIGGTPLLIGCSLSFFVDPSVEASFSVKYELPSKTDRTVYYFDNRKHLGDRLTHYNVEGASESNPKWEIAGSLKGAIWAGLQLEVFLKTIGGCVDEKLTLKLGPEIDGEVKADLVEGIDDRSMYSTLKDSKLRVGLLKTDLKASLTLKATKKIKYTWNQFDLSPERMYLEYDGYMLPEFSPIEYYRGASDLVVSAKMNRNTIFCDNGFRLFDERGNIIDTYYYQDHELYQKGVTVRHVFSGLDYANHRYSVVPITKFLHLFPIQCPGKEVITCSDSNHPHLVDLGLESGTYWSCCNVYAEKPFDKGGYYQWGNPSMCVSYDDSYTPPVTECNSYRGTAWDAATANVGDNFTTPVAEQFVELFSNSDVTYEENRLDDIYGFYVTGPNGNSIFFPSAGFKDGTNVQYADLPMAFYLTSNCASVDEGKKYNLNFKETDVNPYYTVSPWLGFPVRPVDATSFGYEIQVTPSSLIFEDVSVHTSVSKPITVTNVGKGDCYVRLKPFASADSPFYSNDDDVTIKLQSGKSCIFNILFEPYRAGEYHDVVEVLYGAKNETFKVELSGTAVAKEVEGAVDLGLPSGRLWAKCNVGAESSEQKGDLFAWGEIIGYNGGKSSFGWSGYKYCNGSFTKLTKYCTKSYYGNNGFTDNRTVLEYGDDAAAANLTGNWRMPTVEEWNELATNCTWTSATVKGVNGCLITGKNGNTLFLPAAGYRDGASLYDADEAYYWTSSLDVNSPDDAWFFYFGDGHRNRYDYYRSMGRSVRPVYDEYMGREEADGQAAAVSVRRPATQPEPVQLTLADGKIIAIQCHSAEDN